MVIYPCYGWENDKIVPYPSWSEPGKLGLSKDQIPQIAKDTGVGLKVFAVALAPSSVLSRVLSPVVGETLKVSI